MSEFGKDASGGYQPHRADEAQGSPAPHLLGGDLAAKRRIALEAGRDHLQQHQASDGVWQGRAVTSVSATARFVLLQHWLDDGNFPSVASAVQSLHDSRQPDGGWAECGNASGNFDLDASVMAYLALVVHSGQNNRSSATKASLASARDAIIAGGGLPNCDALSRYWLALFGIIDYAECPLVAPEAIRWPSYFVDSLKRLGHWVRAIQVPLSILSSQRPIKILNWDLSLNELYLGGERVRLNRLPRGGSVPSGAAGAFGSGLRLLNKFQIKPWKRSSLSAATDWITANASGDDGLVGSWDGTMLGIVALISRGFRRKNQPVSDLLLSLHHSMVAADGGDGISLPAFHAPTLDTAVSILGIAASSREEGSPKLRSAVEWLLSREITSPGEWAQRVSVEPSGWCREFSNRRFANIPATAMVLQALREQFSENPPSSLVTDDSMVAIIRANSLNLAHRQIAVLDRVAAASRRGRRWLLTLQNPDGGWGHSQQTVTRGRIRTPAEWQSLHDCSTAASTGRVLQSLGAWEMASGQTSVDQAISWLRRNQHADGYWPGRYDASDLESTCAVIGGLRAVGLPRRDTDFQQAAAWCLSMQRDDGGWRCDHDSNAKSTDNRPSDVLATAWALRALVAAGHRDQPTVLRGLHWLLNQQQSDGHWEVGLEHDWSGTVGHRKVGNRVPSLGFRTTVLANAYAMLAIHAFEPHRTKQRANRRGSSSRSSRSTNPR